ncbi:nitroreductase/quinone reductase family protein [Rhodococcus sp. NPDC059234]|uniref:nitroreductase/quinone reductase family protein n=1 Tax=Rhodococcus sp. NPDC059234 TaxID=3346781 RepID=UPI00366E2BB7
MSRPRDRRLVRDVERQHRRAGGGTACLPTVPGRETGTPRTTPVVHLEDGDASVVVGSAFAAKTDPDWTRNLAPYLRCRHPDQAADASMLRAVWWSSAVVALVFSAWVGTSPMAGVSLSCSKSGELYLDGVRSPLQCDDSIVHVLGVWPLLCIGLLLATPPAVAALALRGWVSWLVFAALVGLSIAGLANWSSHWLLLLFAAPLAAVGLVAATVQQAVPSLGRPQIGSTAANPEHVTAGTRPPGLPGPAPAAARRRGSLSPPH